jgi:hypothetical protein
MLPIAPEGEMLAVTTDSTVSEHFHSQLPVPPPADGSSSSSSSSNSDIVVPPLACPDPLVIENGKSVTPLVKQPSIRFEEPDDVVAVSTVTPSRQTSSDYPDVPPSSDTAVQALATQPALMSLPNASSPHHRDEDGNISTVVDVSTYQHIMAASSIIGIKQQMYDLLICLHCRCCYLSLFAGSEHPAPSFLNFIMGGCEIGMMVSCCLLRLFTFGILMFVFGTVRHRLHPIE